MAPAAQERKRERARRHYATNESRRIKQSKTSREYYERLYWGDGVESFIFRASRALRSRRHSALKRMAEREERITNG